MFRFLRYFRLGGIDVTKDLVKHNINFLEYPLWFQNDRLAHASEDGMVWTDINGYVYRAGYKPPVKTDAIFLLYLLLQAQQNQYAGTLILSRYQVLQDCGFGVDAGWYDRLEESLKRWKMVGILFEGTFYDGKDYKVMNFGIIDGWEICEKDKRLKIWFSPRFIEMMRGNGFFKYIKFSEFKQLRSSLATRLYEILSKSFYLDDTFKIEAVRLAEKIPKKEQYPAHIIPKIRTAINRINKSTALQLDFSVMPSKKDEKNKILVFKKIAKSLSEKKDRPGKQQIFEFPKNGELQSLISLLPPERRNHKSLLEAILQAYEKHGSEYVSRNIRYANRNAKKSYRTYLIKSLKLDYGLALQEDEEVSIVKMEAQKQEALENSRKQRVQEEQRQLEQKLHERAREFQQNMGTEGLNALRQEAFSRLDPQIAELVERKAPGAAINLKRMMDRVAIECMAMENEEAAEREKTQES